MLGKRQIEYLEAITRGIDFSRTDDPVSIVIAVHP